MSSSLKNENILRFIFAIFFLTSFSICCTQPLELSLLELRSRTTEPPIESWLVDGTQRALRSFTRIPERRNASNFASSAEKITCPAKRQGFVRVKKTANGFILVHDGDEKFLSIGVNSISPGKSKVSRKQHDKIFKNESVWALQTRRILCEKGFNTAGAWSSNAIYSEDIYSTPILHIMSRFGERLGLTFPRGGHVGFKNDLIPVFDPSFPEFAKQAVAEISKNRDLPNIIGYFIDNELPFPWDALDRSLSLAADNPTHREAIQFLKSRNRMTTKSMIRNEDRKEFLYLMARRYFEITTNAIRQVDPNHLILGSRFHGKVVTREAVIRAAGEFVDVVSINYYGVWKPELENLAKISGWAKRPLIISEWYAMANDAGLKNSSGAGWVVQTQKERGLFYENFIFHLKKSPFVVGYHWFRYMDNDPDRPGDPSNIDSNKGLFTRLYEPWEELMNSARRANFYASDFIESPTP